MEMQRVWAMPSSETFNVKPIRSIVKFWLSKSKVSIDPFARNKRWATHTNDLNPDTKAEHHLDALDFLTLLAEGGIKADLLIFDPPYSPRQISECYQGVGRKVTTEDTQSSFYNKLKEAACLVLTDDAVVISCGWNSCGMGINRGFDLLSVLLVCHGTGHNDTIVTVEKKRPKEQNLFDAVPKQE